MKKRYIVSIINNDGTTQKIAEYSNKKNAQRMNKVLTNIKDNPRYSAQIKEVTTTAKLNAPSSVAGQGKRK